MDKTTELYNFIKINLVDIGFLTIEALDENCNIHGYNTDTLEDVLFYHTSWRDLDQAQEALDTGDFYSNM